MRKTIEFRWLGMLCLMLALPACEKDDNGDENQDPHTLFRPVEYTDKSNGELDERLVYTYDGEKLYTILKYDYSFGEEEEWERTVFSYPNENTILKEEYLLPVDANEMPDDKTVYQLEGGRIIETIDSFYIPQILSPGYYLPGSRYVYTYSGDEVIECWGYWFEDGTWNLNYKETLLYNGSNLTKQEIYMENLDGFLVLFYKYEMEYTNGLLSEMKVYYGNDIWLKKNPVYEGKQIVSAKVYERVNQEWIPYYDMEFTYDTNGNCIKESEYYFDSGSEYTQEMSYEPGKSNYYQLIHPTGRILSQF